MALPKLVKPIVIAIAALTLFGCGSGSSDNQSSVNQSTLTLTGDVTTGYVATDATGLATVPLGSSETNISVVTESDQSPVINASIGYAQLVEGTLVWAHSEDTFPVLEFISVDDPRLQEPRLAVTTLVLGVLAVGSVASAVHEFITDPPKFVEIIESNNVVKTCISGDLNDLLAAFGFASGVSGISTTIRVIGAPANIRGVTAINLGIRKVNVGPTFLGDLTEFVASKMEIFSDDVLIGCQPTLAGEKLPYVEINVLRASEDIPASGTIDVQGSVALQLSVSHGEVIIYGNRSNHVFVPTVHATDGSNSFTMRYCADHGGQYRCNNDDWMVHLNYQGSLYISQGASFETSDRPFKGELSGSYSGDLVNSDGDFISLTATFSAIGLDVINK